MNNSVLNKKFKYVYWNASQILVAVNIIVYILTTMINIKIRGISLFYWMSLIPVFVKQGYVWQFVTYMFVHGDPMHIIFNMYALLMFGSGLERAIGSREFLLYYFVTGIMGGVINYVVTLFTGNIYSVVLGASGAIYALMFLASVIFPENRVLLFFFIPMKMPVAVMVFMALEISSQVFGTTTGVAHLIHLSSVAIGWVYCLVRFRVSPFKVWTRSLR